MLTIGERIRTLRKFSDLSQEEFAARLGITNGFVSNLEKNVREPSEQLLKLISYEFSCSAKWLTIGEGEMFLSPEEVIKEQMARYGERAFIEAFSKVLDEQGLVIPITALGTRGEKHLDPNLKDIINFFTDLWTVADDETKIWAKVQFARAFPEDVRDEVEKKLAAPDRNATSS